MAFPFQKSLSDVPDKWKVYSKQHDALKYLHSKTDRLLRLFTFENVCRGKSVFTYLICKLDDFWEAYAIHEIRHLYEVIVKDTPCRLYFDIDFQHQQNPAFGGETVVQTFVQAVASKLDDVFGIAVSYDDVIDLESSSTAKFSRHLIFHLPGERLFANNLHMGRFVRCIDCIVRSTSNDAQDTLGGTAANCDGKGVSICDTAVYTRNRNFRLFLSSKFGKPNVLRLARACRFYSSRGNEQPSEKQIFKDSLVRPETSSCVPANLLLFEEDPASSKKRRVRYSEWCSNESNSDNTARNKTVKLSQHSDIDRFILNLACEGSLCVFEAKFPKQTKIGTLCLANQEPRIANCESSTSGTDSLLLYVIDGYRFCRNIGRQHRRNRIRYVANVTQMMCYQTCFDEKCKGFQSNEFPILTMPTEAEATQPNIGSDDDSLSDGALVEHANAVEEEQMKGAPCCSTSSHSRVRGMDDDELSDEVLLRHVTELEQSGLV